MAHRPDIERASAGDRAFLAMDRGEVPEQFGVILLLDEAEGLDLPDVRQLVAGRIAAVRRLRQRLVHVPLGRGGPIWVDDPAFDIRHHVRAVSCPSPGDEESLWGTALSLVTTRLPAGAPLWRVVLIRGLAGHRAALVVVLHHVLADGVGGLAVLAHLVDPGGAAADLGFPAGRPSDRELVSDAWRARLGAVRGLARWWRLVRLSMQAGGGLRPPPVAPCSLNQRTGPRRQMAVLRVEHAALRTAAHAYGASTNDAVLVAVAGALHRVLRERGELVDSFVMTVPVSGRPAGNGALGNMVSPMLVDVPGSGPVGQRLKRVATEVRAVKASATGPPPIALLGWLFRPLAAFGGYRWYMNRQHRFHTLVSSVRGPEETLTFGGMPVAWAVPIGVGEGGNATVSFQVLSYAGTLSITAIVDPDHFPDLDRLTESLHIELDLMAHPAVEMPVRRKHEDTPPAR